MDVVELVANVSEGRDAAIVDALVRAPAAAGAAVLDVHADPDHHRSVLTLGGSPDTMVRAADALSGACIRLLDIRAQQGAHPRLGTLDVVPFVPLRCHADTARRCANEAGVAISGRGIPVFLYENAVDPPRALPVVRKRAFDTLMPDFGPSKPHVRAGASVVGARNVLVAYNVDVALDDLSDARRVAAQVRASNGGPPGIRALALRLEDQKRVQISMNLTRPETAGIGAAWKAVRDAGAEPVRGELVGLAPEVALADADATILEMSGIDPARTLEAALLEAGLI